MFEQEIYKRSAFSYW